MWSREWYKYILQMENFVTSQMKMNPFEIESKMTLFDFDVWVEGVFNEIKRKNEDERETTGDNVLKSLRVIRNILMNLKLGDQYDGF